MFSFRNRIWKDNSYENKKDKRVVTEREEKALTTAAESEVLN